MRKPLAKYIGYPSHDWMRGTLIMKTRKFLMESQYWDEEKIKNYQLEKIKKLVKHSFDNISYYRKLFNENKISPADINTIDDLKKIPILTKEIARRENQNLTISNINTMRNVFKGETGGTTGVSLTVYKDIAARSFTWGAFYRWYDWLGINLGDPILLVEGGAAFQRKKSITHTLMNFTKDMLLNTTTLNYFDIKENRLSSTLKKVFSYNPTLIKGYLGTMIDLASYLRNNQIEINSPKAVSTTASTLLEPYRKLIEDQLKAPVYDQYGCGECESIAFECPEHNGLHINMEHVFMEIINENEEDVSNGTGRVVVTDLDNTVMPFIRYENGDLATFSNEICKCGVRQPLLKAVDGRISDYIRLSDGRKVTGAYFTKLLSLILDPQLHLKIDRFQVYQEKIGQIEFRLESKYQIEKEITGRIYSLLKKDFSNVEIKVMREIKLEKSGKFRWVKSKLNDEIAD